MKKSKIFQHPLGLSDELSFVSDLRGSDFGFTLGRCPFGFAEDSLRNKLCCE